MSARNNAERISALQSVHHCTNILLGFITVLLLITFIMVSVYISRTDNNTYAISLLQTTTPPSSPSSPLSGNDPIAVETYYPDDRELLYRFLDTNGDSTGIIDGIGDYSSGIVRFYIQPPANHTYFIARLLVEVEDSGGFDSGLYGNNVVLTNGIQVQIRNDIGIVTDLTAGYPITTNSDWGRYTYDFSHNNFGSGNEFLHVRWSFYKSQGIVRLRGDLNERLEVRLNDNFGGLIGHRFHIQGYTDMIVP